MTRRLLSALAGTLVTVVLLPGMASAQVAVAPQTTLKIQQPSGTLVTCNVSVTSTTGSSFPSASGRVSCDRSGLSFDVALRYYRTYNAGATIYSFYRPESGSCANTSYCALGPILQEYTRPAAYRAVFDATVYHSGTGIGGPGCTPLAQNGAPMRCSVIDADAIAV